MVMIKLDGMITDINGKLGGHIYRYDNCGLHLQQNPYTPRPPTDDQRIQRAVFRAALNAWQKQLLTPAQTVAWYTYGARHPKKNKKGETYFLCPFLSFMAVNMIRIIKGQDVTYDPPSD